MAKPELGVKRTCVACGAKFYDLGKQPAVCPKCGTEQPAEQPRPRRAALPPEDKVKKRVAPVADPDADDVEIEDVDADEVEETEDLDDAEDDLDVEVVGDPDRADATCSAWGRHRPRPTPPGSGAWLPRAHRPAA
jgi:uncharacterized protein (TIGR02300 family)